MVWVVTNLRAQWNVHRAFGQCWAIRLWKSICKEKQNIKCFPWKIDSLIWPHIPCRTEHVNQIKVADDLRPFELYTNQWKIVCKSLEHVAFFKADSSWHAPIHGPISWGEKDVVRRYFHGSLSATGSHPRCQTWDIIWPDPCVLLKPQTKICSPGDVYIQLRWYQRKFQCEVVSLRLRLSRPGSSFPPALVEKCGAVQHRLCRQVSFLDLCTTVPQDCGPASNEELLNLPTKKHLCTWYGKNSSFFICVMSLATACSNPVLRRPWGITQQERSL